MTETEASKRLLMLIDGDSDPEITLDELGMILATARRSDAAGNPTTNVDTADTWTASTTVAFGDVVTADPATGRWWLCVTPGTTGDTQPDWPDRDRQPPFDKTVVDGSVVWSDAGTAWTPTWDLDAAAAEGWRVKASKVAGRFDFTTDGQNFQRSQVAAHCRQMERMFRRKISSGV